ncbi:monocarboxylate transporter 10-like [Episyrphus balteatus]|uniref:monocarboxylate transporter 10-like n=1 Tax=Episyrphus balteatus TaxID=286459 RepID=UPI002484E621|nr:monocarboxylate transporter 10-like [Episyrphus balteatus]
MEEKKWTPTGSAASTSRNTNKQLLPRTIRNKDADSYEATENTYHGRSSYTTKIQQRITTEYNPPDGGTRAWLAMISAFFCLGLIFGLINSYSVIYSYLQRRFTSWEDPEASSKAALIGSFTFGTTLFCSPIAGMMTDKIGVPFTTLIGGVISVLGLFFSSLSPWSVTGLLFTYGFMLGLGSSLVYTPTLSVLGIYFKRYLGKVNGFVCTGASIFTVIMPPILSYILTTYDFRTALQVLAVCFCFLIVSAFVYGPMQCPVVKESGDGHSSPVFNIDIWKERSYIIWTLSCALALSGYYVSYVHMVKFTQINFPRRNSNLPIMCIGAASCIGRMIVGILADIPGINRIRIHQGSLIGMGVVTVMLPYISSFNTLLISSAALGVFDGMFFPVLGPICYQLCGSSGAAQAIGCFLGLVAVPMTIGPVLAGKIFDETQSYTLPFIIAGIPSILGALCMCFIDNNSEYERLDCFETVQEGVSSSNLLNENTYSIVIESAKAALPEKETSVSDTPKRRYRYTIL